MVVSTVCRGCGQHISITDEKPVMRPQYTTRLATDQKPPVEYPSVAAEAVPEKVEKKQASQGIFSRFFTKERLKRKLNCYHCEHVFEVISEAQSTQCSKCGGYISLRDYTIDQAWRRQIQTRGNVTVLKGASIIGVHVQCHDLLVLGKLSASVECSGKLAIRSHGKILGNVRCDELRIERGAKVEFQGDVYARSAYIDGEVKAQITCTGTITLEKKAHLQGLARAAGLVVKAGAKHSGLMEVVKNKDED